MLHVALRSLEILFATVVGRKPAAQAAVRMGSCQGRPRGQGFGQPGGSHWILGKGFSRHLPVLILRSLGQRLRGWGQEARDCHTRSSAEKPVNGGRTEMVGMGLTTPLTCANNWLMV